MVAISAWSWDPSGHGWARSLQDGRGFPQCEGIVEDPRRNIVGIERHPMWRYTKSEGLLPRCDACLHIQDRTCARGRTARAAGWVHREGSGVGARCAG